MLPSVEAALTLLSAELPPEEALQIKTYTAAVTAALASKETARLKQSLATLDNATQTLATRLIEKAMG